MGVYIKDMEMPKTCEDCQFHRYHSHHEYVCVATPLFYPMNLANSEGIRKDWCPLVALPDHHGRLIDENEVRIVMNWLLTQPQRPTWNDTYHAIQEMNAVIEAGDENG